MVVLVFMEFMALDNNKNNRESTWCLAETGKLKKLLLNGNKIKKKWGEGSGEWPQNGRMIGKRTFQELTPFI